MDMLARRTGTSSRRGTLLPGGARRNDTSGPVSSTEPKKDPVKIALLAEFRAHEEDQAALVVQRAVRVFLSRRFVTRLLLQVYCRQYDPIEKQYYYVNTATNEITWDKPRALQLFLAESQDVPVLGRPHGSILPANEAAKRIQRAARALLARRLIQHLVRDSYMKLFDATTKTFYYLNTRTGETSPDKPLSLRAGDNANDIPVETFQFRKCVCKLSSRANLYGSGVLGLFGGGSGGASDANGSPTSTRWLCLLSDAKTLPDAATAAAAHAVCNFAPDGSAVPFHVPLRPEQFFTTLVVDQAPRFALCAVDHTAFLERASAAFQPLTFELNDQKLGCADATRGTVKLQDALEIVGHPHGKPRVVHSRRLRKMRPHSIAPVTMEYDKEVESGAAGCAVFTRGGKLLGMQQFSPLKEPPPTSFYYIRPILDAATALVTPPEPFLLTTCLASREIHACWSIVRWFHTLPGLAIEYELELCRHERSTTSSQSSSRTKLQNATTFELVYRGPNKSRQVGHLQSDTAYSLRVRACNALVKSKWSHVLKFRTLPAPSLAWRITRYCSSVRDACWSMEQQRTDVETQRSGIQWLLRHLDQTDEPDVAEREFVDARGVDWVLETVRSRFPSDDEVVRLTLRLLTRLVGLHGRAQQLLSQVKCMEQILTLLQRHVVVDVVVQDPEKIEIGRQCVELLGAVLDGDNASAQQAAQALELVPTLLTLLAPDDNNKRMRHDTSFTADCVFLFARYSHGHTRSGKWQFVHHGRLCVLRDMLELYADDASVSTIVYWALITLGNVAYGSECPGSEDRATLEQQIDALHLVPVICAARTHFLVRIHELELSIGAAQRAFEQLAASVMGEDMRNEMDAREHEIATLTHAREELLAAGDVAAAADFALRYALNEAQRRVQEAALTLTRQFLQRQRGAAFVKWHRATVWAHHCGVFQAFLTTVRHRQLSAAFRKWEQFLRAWRRHHQSVVVQTVLGAGLAIDLNRTKKERYRMLVLQK